LSYHEIHVYMVFLVYNNSLNMARKICVCTVLLRSVLSDQLYLCCCCSKLYISDPYYVFFLHLSHVSIPIFNLCQLRGDYSVQVQLVHLVILYWEALSSVHYIFRPNWPCSGVYYVRLLLGCNVVFTASASVSYLCVFAGS
jgi:hypothetical protein